MFNFQGPTKVGKPWRVGSTNAEGPPVPIPNTEVKLCSADNTLLATAREDRSEPTPAERSSKELLEVGKRKNGGAKPLKYGGVAQLGEHLPCKQGVMGSNPIISTKAKAGRTPKEISSMGL